MKKNSITKIILISILTLGASLQVRASEIEIGPDGTRIVYGPPYSRSDGSVCYPKTFTQRDGSSYTEQNCSNRSFRINRRPYGGPNPYPIDRTENHVEIINRLDRIESAVSKILTIEEKRERTHQ